MRKIEAVCYAVYYAGLKIFNKLPMEIKYFKKIEKVQDCVKMFLEYTFILYCRWVF
jgi:hypothetical protein